MSQFRSYFENVRLSTIEGYLAEPKKIKKLIEYVETEKINIMAYFTGKPFKMIEVMEQPFSYGEDSRAKNTSEQPELEEDGVMFGITIEELINSGCVICITLSTEDYSKFIKIDTKNLNVLYESNFDKGIIPKIKMKEKSREEEI